MKNESSRKPFVKFQRKVIQNSSVIISNVIYKVKESYRLLKMKPRIGLHGNKGEDNYILKTDTSQCPFTEMRIMLYISTIEKCLLVKIEFTKSFV